MDHVDPALRTPSTPFITPRAPGYREEKRRHNDSKQEPEGNSESDDDLDLPQGGRQREDENKGANIDIQI